MLAASISNNMKKRQIGYHRGKVKRKISNNNRRNISTRAWLRFFLTEISSQTFQKVILFSIFFFLLKKQKHIGDFLFSYGTLYRLSRVKSWAAAIQDKTKRVTNKQNLSPSSREKLSWRNGEERKGEERRGEGTGPMQVNSFYQNRSSRRNKLAGFYRYNTE